MHWHQACNLLGYDKVARIWQQGHSLQTTTSIPSWITALSWRRGLHNSVKLQVKPCRTTQDRQVIVKSSSKSWSNRGDNGKPFQYSCWENARNSIKRQKRYDTGRWTPQIRRCPMCYWDEMVRWHHRLNGHKSEQTPGDSGGQRSLALVHGVTKGQTWLSNSTTTPPPPQETLSLRVSGWARPVDIL